jgi:hypothetical protein
MTQVRCVHPTQKGGQYHHLLPDGVEGDSNSLQLIAMHVGPLVLPA